MRKIIISNVILIFVLVLCLFIIPSRFAIAAEINDLDSASDYARNSIANLAAKGVISGDENNNFNPFDFTTRAQVAKMLVISLNIDTNVVPEVPTFKDVPKEHWSFKYVEAAYREGIISGYSPDTFGVNDICTREQTTKMFVNSMKLSPEAIAKRGGGAQGISNLEDNDKISNWAVDAVALSFREGLIKGVTETSFAPSMYTTREQMAVITDRFVTTMDNVKHRTSVSENMQVVPYLNSIIISYSDPTKVVYLDSITDSDGNSIPVDDSIIYTQEDNQYTIRAFQPVEGEHYRRRFYRKDDAPLFETGKTYTVRTKFMDSNRDFIFNDFVINSSYGDSNYVITVLPLNANQIKINYKSYLKLDKSTLVDKVNYTVKDDSGRVIEIQDIKEELSNYDGDLRSVITLSEPIIGPEKIHITISGIKNSNGDEYPEFNKSLFFYDREAPDYTLLELKYTDPNHLYLKVSFDEYVRSAAVIINNKFAGFIEGQSKEFYIEALDLGRAPTVYILNITDGVNTKPFIAYDKGTIRLIQKKVFELWKPYTPQKPLVKNITYTKDNTGRVNYIILNLNYPLNLNNYSIYSIGSPTVFDSDYNWKYIQNPERVIDGATGAVRYIEGRKLFCENSLSLTYGATSIVLPVSNGINIYSGKYTFALDSNISFIQYQNSSNYIPRVYTINFDK